MVNLADLAAHHDSPKAAERLKKRKFAEWRLKAYGIGAIVLAGVALITLLSTVIGQATDALTESYVTIDVALVQDEIDPKNTNDPSEIGRANFGGVVKDAMKVAFPDVTGRKPRRALYGIVSSGAAFELRDAVMADPTMIGQSEPMRLLASDVTDLYLKGSFGKLTEVPHIGALTLNIAQDGKSVVVQSSADDFAPVLAVVKSNLVEQANFQRQQAELQDRGAIVFKARADNAEEDEIRAKNEALYTARAAERDRLIADAETLDARAADVGSVEALDVDEPSVLIRVAGGWVKLTEVSNTGGKGDIIMPLQGSGEIAAAEWVNYVPDLPENARKVSDAQIIWIESLRDKGAIDTVFNKRFFTSGDSREPEMAGVWGAVVGSFWTMLVTFILSFPIGVLAAIYLEEFAPRNRLTDFIEVNINNLAAVPSIIFGLLGLAVFQIFFGLPRSSPLLGGVVLALMTLPTIVISARVSFRAVPPSIRDAALGLGASRLQTSFHHVLPLAMPGIMTGTIIGISRALGETAPLILVGMVAFIGNVPSSIFDVSSVLPVQVYLWSDFPERAFEARTAAAVCTLLVFLIVMNALAVFLRKRFERRW